MLTTQKKICAAISAAQQEHHADVIVFPELALSSYPPEDLLLRNDFLEHIQTALHKICQHTKDIHVIVGHPHREGTHLHNAASILFEGKIIDTYYKQILPNYAVFDEKRYFVAGQKSCVVRIKDIACGITICEDLWSPQAAARAKQAGAELIISLNASPFHERQADIRLDTFRQRIQETELPILYVNLVGGQDELIFDGGSLALQNNGELLTHADFFKETLLPITAQKTAGNIKLSAEKNTLPYQHNKTELIYKALVLGTRDYIQKNNFSGALLGLSGGIDSALTLAVACDAIGADNVHAVMMPSEYTAELSLDGAKQEAEALGVQYSVISIEPVFHTFLASLKEEFKNSRADITEENLQARCRGVLLMALSNKTGKIVLNTGNKSEIAVGYCTLYGDMTGGFGVLKDVFKTQVYELAAYRNQISPVIPEAVIKRPPSAELAPNQLDQDSLPPYPILDKILQLYVEENHSLKEIIESGISKETVTKVIRLIQRSEYKRRQAPPGVRITKRGFGKDWRLPITNGFENS